MQGIAWPCDKDGISTVLPLKHWRQEGETAMKEIVLSNGMKTQVDDVDYEKLRGYRWCATKTSPSHKTYYVQRRKGNTHVYMHKEIMDNYATGLVTDHVDGDGLNNQRINLRTVTQRQNSQNQANMILSSKYPGVYWNKAAKKWYSHIRLNGPQIYLGMYHSEETAYAIYAAALKAYGETIIENGGNSNGLY
jgi:hypothetical protein